MCRPLLVLTGLFMAGISCPAQAPQKLTLQEAEQIAIQNHAFGDLVPGVQSGKFSLAAAGRSRRFN